MLDLLKVCLNSKAELFDENLFESRNVILFVEQQHRFFIVDTVNRAERYRAVPVGYQDGVAGDACNAFVAIVECLNI